MKAHPEFIVFGQPYFDTDEIDEVVETLKSGWVGTGPRVKRFEDAFRSYKSSEHALALNSCTAALHLSLLAAGVGPGDEVITTSMTFCATLNVVFHSGATPVLVDCDRSTMNLTAEAIAEKITPQTKAVIIVHFAGRMCDMEPIVALCKKRGLLLIEDCAHAIEAEYRGKRAGTFGDFGAFSFYVTKNLTTGEGGMLLTPHADFADKVKILALHGMTKDAWDRFKDKGYKHYQVVEPGFKYNMMDLQAAIGLHQLKKIEAHWLRRQEIWNYYTSQLESMPLILPSPPEVGTRHAFHLYTPLLCLDEVAISRDELLEELYRQGIGTGVHYLALHRHPFYKEALRFPDENFPNANFISERTFSIPLSPYLSDSEVERIVSALKKILTSRTVQKGICTTNA